MNWQLFVEAMLVVAWGVVAYLTIRDIKLNERMHDMLEEAGEDHDALWSMVGALTARVRRLEVAALGNTGAPKTPGVIAAAVDSTQPNVPTPAPVTLSTITEAPAAQSDKRA